MRKNIIISSVLASLIVAWIVWLSSSAHDNFTSNWENGFKMFGMERWIWGFSTKKGLTDEEKIALESMTKEEKQTFFETKREEMQAEMEQFRIEREAKEAVIDSLLAWNALTSEQEALRAEIIAERSERKIAMEDMRVKMEQVHSIMKKKKNGEDLTEQEQAVLDEMWWHRWPWKMMMGRGMHR